MADGLDTAAITEGLTELNNTTSSINDKMSQPGALEKEIEGLTTSQKEASDKITEAVHELPDAFKKVLADLAISKNLESLTTALQDEFNQTKQERLGQKEKIKAEKEGLKKAKKDASDSDVANLSASMGTPALYLGKILKDLFGKDAADYQNSLCFKALDYVFLNEKSPFFEFLKKTFEADDSKKDKKEKKSTGNKISDMESIQFFKSLKETVEKIKPIEPGKSKDKPEKEVKGPGGESKGLAKLAASLNLMVAAAIAVGEIKALKSLLNLQALGKFTLYSYQMAKWLDENDATKKAKSLQEFSLEMAKAFDNLNQTIKSANSVGFKALIGLISIEFISSFLIEVMNLKDPIKNLQEITSQKSIINDMSSIFNDLENIARKAGLLGKLSKSGKKGLEASVSLIAEVKIVIDELKKITSKTLKSQSEIIKDVSNLIGDLFDIALWSSLMLFVAIPGALGLKVSVIFIRALQGFITVISSLNIDGDKLKDFGKAVGELSGIFKKLLVIMLLAIAAGILAILATFALIGVLVFMIGVALLGAVALLVKPMTTEFAATVLLISAAMLLFAITMMFIQMLMPGIFFKQIMMLLINIALVFVGVALLGLLAIFAVLPIAAFALTSILLALAFVLLWLGLLVLNHLLGPQLAAAPNNINQVGLFFLSLVQYLPQFLVGALCAIALVIAAVLLLVATIVLIITVLLLGVLAGLIVMLMNMKLPPINGIDEGMVPGTGFIAAIAIFFISIALLMPIILSALIPIVLLLVASILLLVTFVALTITILLAMAITKIIASDPTILDIGYSIMKFFAALIPAGLVAIPMMILAIPLLAVAILLMTAFIALTITILLAKAITKIITSSPLLLLVGFMLLGFFTALIPAGAAAIVAMIVAVPLLAAAVLLLGAFAALTATIALALAIQKMSENIKMDIIRQRIYDLYDIINLKLMMKSVAIVMMGASVLAAAVMMMTIMTSIVLTYKAIEKLEEIQDKVNPEPVFKAVTFLAQLVKESSEQTKGASILALAAFKLGIGAIIEAIKGITDIILKLADPQTVKDIDPAVENLKKIIQEFFGLDATGKVVEGQFTVMGILSSIGGISKGQLRATQALVPLTEALDNITDTIIKVIDIENVSQGIENLKQISGFITELQEFANGFSGGFFGIGDSTKKVKKATEATGEMIPLIDNLATIGGKVKEFEGIKLNIKEFIIDPLENLSDGTNALREIKSAVGALNTELNKLAKDNKDTLKGIASIGKGNAAGINQFVLKLNAAFKKANSGGGDKDSTAPDPLTEIQKDVRGIAEKLIQNKTSWTGS